MRILVSACLLGNPVRYDGRSKPLGQPLLDDLVARDLVIAFCPEVAGGLSVPRKPAEILSGSGEDVLSGKARVQTRSGEDVTAYFIDGARQALGLCRQHGIRVAILTESSPSCGSSRIYDGSFTRTALPGTGVTAALLREHGIAVFNQHQLQAAVKALGCGGDGDGE